MYKTNKIILKNSCLLKCDGTSFGERFSTFRTNIGNKSPQLYSVTSQKTESLQHSCEYLRTFTMIRIVSSHNLKHLIVTCNYKQTK